MEHFHVLCPALVSKPSVSCPDPVLIEGQSVKLPCDADSFVWTKDGKAVVSGDRFSFHDGNSVVHQSSGLQRLGRVHLSNDLSSESAKCNLHVYC